MSDMLSQDEINALLGQGEAGSDVVLTDEQKDILGEVGNISMGTSATTLSTLVGRKVDISTPRVEVIEIRDLSRKYDRPCVGLRIDYKEGLIGSNILILKQDDTKIISSLMSGGDGTFDPNEDLTELQLSAISEAMNQMIGSSSTSLSSMLNYKIDIDTPQAFIIDFEDDSFFEKIDLGGEKVVCNVFKMTVEGLIDSEIMQMLPIEFAENIITTLKPEQPKVKSDNQQAPTQQLSPQNNINVQENADNSNSNSPSFNKSNVNVKTVQFQNFDETAFIQQKENIVIIQDVPLEVTVELGRAKKPIKEILEFSPGTILELDKIAGEPIDILVNGKFIAKGEVVVIDENFGVRITDIISANDRI